jgi:hypothetical protein
MTYNGRWPLEFRYIQQWCTRSFNPKIEVYEDQTRVWNEAMRTSWLSLLIDPKSDPSVSKVVQQISLLDWSTTMEESYTQAILRKIGCYSMWIDNHLLEMKVEATYGTKDDPVPSQTKVCPVWTQDLDYLQKFLLRVVAHLVSQIHLSFWLLQISGMRFLLRVVVCHIPKIWNVKIK